MLELTAATALIFIGVVGIWGARTRRIGILNLHVVAALLAMLVTFQTVTEVSKEVRTDCALAELHLRTKQLQEYAKAQPQAVLFEAVHHRLNEVENLVGDVDSRVTSLTEGLHTKVKDIKFLRDKLEHLKTSAQGLLTSLPQNTAPKVDGAPADPLTPELEHDLKERIGLATQVLQRLHLDEQNKEDLNLSYEEYVQLLNALTAAATKPLPFTNQPLLDPASLGHAHHELPQVKAAIERLDARSSSDLAQEKEQAHEAHRNKWAEKFRALIEYHQGGQSNMYSLGDMPEHCVKGQAAGALLDKAFWLLALLEGLSVYLALTLATALAKKD